MRTELSDKLGITHPIFAFTPSEHVAAAVSRAGGLGVLGCVRFNDAAELDDVLTWMDANTDGKPYGVDIVMPAKVPSEGTATDLSQYIPDDHKAFVQETLRKLGVPPLPADDDPGREGVLGWLHSVARAHVEVALKHRPALIANALGSPPKDVIDQAHEHGIPVAALAGKAKHAISHLDNGVDIIIAQGTEAGGHTGEIATMVLVPEIVDAVGDRGPRAGRRRHRVGTPGRGRARRGLRCALACGWAQYSADLVGVPDGQQRRDQARAAGGRSSGPDSPLAGLQAASRPACCAPSGRTPGTRTARSRRRCRCRLQNLLVNEAHQRIGASNDPEVVAMPVGQIVGRMNFLSAAPWPSSSPSSSPNSRPRRWGGWTSCAERSVNDLSRQRRLILSRQR